MKTSKLTGVALDWVAAKCERKTKLYQKRRGEARVIDTGHPEYAASYRRDHASYSTDWAKGGPIIERECICVDIGHNGVWLAYTKQNYDDEKEFMHAGPTPLIAAMRCFVASRLGEEVEIPEELA